MKVTAIEYFRTEFHRITTDRGDPSSGAPKRKPSRGFTPNLRIVDLMEGDLASVGPETPIVQAVRLMIEHGISSVPVVDKEFRIVGALNESGLMKVFCEPDTRCVADVMVRHPIILPIDAPLVDVIDRLMSSDFRRVLIQENGRLVGVITRSHVMPALLAALEGAAITREGARKH